jgi:hypothetical protein
VSIFHNRAMNAFARLTCCFAALVCAPLAHAEETPNGGFYGMLRARDLSPFGFLRLDMRPAHAVSLEEGEWIIETEGGYQNTWALSRNVETYLTDLEAQGRREIGPTEIAAIQALPGENYLLDVELATLDVSMHYKLSQQWSVYTIVSAVSYEGGFLDSTIESFHDSFGFSSFGRPAVKRNDTNVIIDLKSASVVMLEAPKTRGFLDPTFGVRYSGINLPAPWQMSVELAAKIPLEGERSLFSTGRADYGSQVSLRRLGHRHGVHIDFSTVYYAGERVPVVHEAQFIPTLVIGWEYRLTDYTNLQLQGYASRSVYREAQTDLDELLSEKFQLSLGVRHRVRNLVISFAATENLQNLNNTPDIGFQLGLAWLGK